MTPSVPVFLIAAAAVAPVLAQGTSPYFPPDGAVAPEIAPPRFVVDPGAALGPADADLAAPSIEGMAIAPDRSVLHFDEVEGTTWVRGRTYKASAGPDGFTFVPFLGSNAERNWPVQFSLSSAQAGGESLRVATTPRVSRDGKDVWLDRGDVQAHYRLGLDGVEQLFHIDPEGLAGALVLTLDVETDLVGRPDGGGLRFEGPEGAVDYTAAIALDETGRVVEVPVLLEGGRLRLTVPAAFVESAVGGITVDPVLTTFTVDDVTGDQRNVAAAYAGSEDAILFVYEDTFSGTDGDIYMSIVNVGGGSVAATYVDASTESWADPEVATLRGDNVALVVATRELAGDDPIMGRIYDIDGLTFPNPAFEIADTGAGGSNTWTNAHPDVGGSRSSALGNGFMVCWRREFSAGGFSARFASVDAAGSVGPTLFLGPAGPLSTVDQVRISPTTGDTGTTNAWNFCYTDTPAGGIPQVWSGRFNPDGTLASPPAVVFANAVTVFRAMDISDALVIDGLDPAYVITYDNFGAGDEDVIAILCRNGNFVSAVDVNVREHAVTGFNQDGARVVATRDRFVVAYQEERTASEWPTYLTVLDLVEGVQLSVAERRVVMGPLSTVFSRGLGLASRWSGGLNSRWVGLGWSVQLAGAPDQDVTGGVLAADTPESPAFQFCEGTVNSTGDRGFLRLAGSRSAGTTKTAIAEAIPPGQFCLLISGSNFGNTPALGGGEGQLCLGGTLGRYNSQLAAASSAGVVEFTIDPANIPSGGNFFTATPGTIYQWQVWHRDVNASGPTSNLTNGVTILFN